MDKAVLATLFLTGLCVLSSSFPFVYYFIEEEMIWSDAQNYCNSEYITMTQIKNVEDANAVCNTPTGGYTGKAWIGLFAYGFQWIWLDGRQATAPNWKFRPPHQNTEFCAVMCSDGLWTDASCSDKKPFVCHDGEQYYLNQSPSTWIEARASCKANGSDLVSIQDSVMNSQILGSFSSQVWPAWIGIYKRKLWGWYGEPGENKGFMNWQNGQPSELNLSDNCAAVMLTNGSWTDKPCNSTYPFFCTGVYKARETVVKIRIHSSKDMEDPALSADLLKQLTAALAQQGLTDFHLTWKKLPEKMQVEQ